MRGARWGIGLVAALACALVLAASASAADSLFWSNFAASTVSRVSLTGGDAANAVAMTPDVDHPYGTAIDAATGKVYWTNYYADTIGYANLDGSEPGLLNVGTATVSNPAGLAIDPAAGKLYWVNAGGGGISYANLDGSGGGNLATAGASFDEPYGLVVDPALGRVYWTNYESSTIDYASLDGSGGGALDITPVAPEGPLGIAIDAAQGRIYWTNNEGSTIGSANLDGSESELLPISAALIKTPDGLAIDPATETIYWANEAGGSIGTASLTGTGASILDTSRVDTDGPNFPVLLEVPKAATAPSVSAAGSTLTCTPGTWAPDLLESFLYRAPERTTVGWTLNGTTLNGATGTTLTANQTGSYACQVTATNGAGSTVATSNAVAATGPANNGAVGVSLVPAPSVKVTKVKLDRKNGTATVLAKVSGPGKLFLRGRQVVRDSVRSSGVGIAKVQVVAKGKALRALKATGKAKVRISLRFLTTEGRVATASRSIVLHLADAGR